MRFSNFFSHSASKPAQDELIRQAAQGEVLRRQILPLLVGAGRCERPTPCAQVGLLRSLEVAYFQRFLFQRDGGALLKAVELC